jgi:hypothetical protein
MFRMTDPEVSEEQATLLRCDTCGRLTPTVSRVVVEAGYNRANARPLYNCPDCYEKKNRERLKGAPPP